MEVYNDGHMHAFSDMTIFEAQYAIYGHDVAHMVVDPSDFTSCAIEDSSSEIDTPERDYASCITEWKQNTDYLVVNSATQIIPPPDVTLQGSPLTERQIVLIIPSDSDPSNVSMVTLRVVSVDKRL